MEELRAEDGMPVAAEVYEALRAIVAGSTGDAQETATLEFKEDPALRDPGKPDAKLIEMLLGEAVCLANGEGGEAHIVLGVSDKVAGPEALTGTQRQPAWIEQKLANGTKPSLRVEAHPLLFADVRLLWIRLPRQYTVYARTKGQASYRVGTSCEPMTDQARRTIAAKRANPDFSAEASSRSLDELKPAALEAARALLRSRRQIAGGTDNVPEIAAGLLSSLGLLTSGGQLTVAGELLFCELPPPRLSVRHLLRRVPGGAPSALELSGPLILVISELTEAIGRNASSEIARVTLDDGQEVAIPAFPQTAVDEIITNALIHRDWGLFAPVVVDQSPSTLKVVSPGPLPHGVSEDRLLTTTSTPRNPLLMAAMRQLGLAEEPSRGFDRMWVSMLHSGRDVPEVDATDQAVEVVLAAGQPDADFIRAVRELAAEFGDDMMDSVTVLLVVRHLYLHPMIALKQVIKETQVSEIEARNTMQWLETSGVVDKVRAADEWVLSQRSRQVSGLAGQPVATVSVQEWIEERFRGGDELTAREIAVETGMERHEITGILTHLRNLGRAVIVPTGPQRGPNTRWAAP